MRCQEVMELMQRYLDVDLAEAEERVMLAHLRDCPECADMFERLKLLNEELVELPKVSPPYSIVDSIMPKLEELALWNEPSAASDAGTGAASAVSANVVSMEADRRERRGLISWRLVAGVAAAGIVLGMFIFNSNSAVHDKKAESMLADTNSASKASAVSDVANQAGAEASRVDGAKQIVNETFEAKDQFGGAISAPSPATKEDKLGSGDSAAALIRPDTVVTTSSASGSERKELSPKSEAPVNEPMHSVGAEAGSPEKVKATSEPLFTAKQGNEPSPAPAPTPTITTPADNEAVQKSGTVGTKPGITSVTDHPSAAPLQESVSPNGDFTVRIKEGTLILTGKDGRTLYTVSPALKEGERLELGKWIEAAKVIYSIVHADGQTTSIQVDAAARTETKL